MKRISDMTDKEFAAFNDDEESYRRDALDLDLMSQQEDAADFEVFDVPGSEF